MLLFLFRLAWFSHFFSEFPTWLKKGASVDVLSPIDSTWYSGKIKSLDDIFNELSFTVLFPKHEPEKYEWRKIVGDIRPHIDERLLVPRANLKDIEVLQKMARGDPVMVKDHLQKVAINDPMRGHLVLENNEILMYEDVDLHDLHVETAPVKKRKQTKPPHKDTEGTDTPNKTQAQKNLETVLKTKPQKETEPTDTQKKKQAPKKKRLAANTENEGNPKKKLDTKEDTTQKQGKQRKELGGASKLAKIITSGTGTVSVTNAAKDVMDKENRPLFNVINESENMKLVLNEIKSVSEKVDAVRTEVINQIKTVNEKIDNLRAEVKAALEKRFSFDLGHFDSFNLDNVMPSPQQQSSTQPNATQQTTQINVTQGNTETSANPQSEQNVPLSSILAEAGKCIHNSPTPSFTQLTSPFTEEPTFLQPTPQPLPAPLPAPLIHTQTKQASHTHTYPTQQTFTYPTQTQPQQTPQTPPYHAQQTFTHPTQAQTTVPQSQQTAHTLAQQKKVQQSTPQSSTNNNDSSVFSARWELLKFQAKGKRESFAWIVVKDLFADDELKGRNCRGITNIKNKVKKQLDSTKMWNVFQIVFHCFPVLDHEKQDKAWRDCETHIDSCIRKKLGACNFWEEV